MPYLVKGNAEQIFHAFGQDWVISEGKNDLEVIHNDFSRTHFLGTDSQAKEHYNLWKQVLKNYYLQGNMSAGNLLFLLGQQPLINQNNQEDLEKYHRNLIRQHFAYMNDKGENCGLMVVYRKDNPKQWIMGLVKNNHLLPKDREIVFLSNFDLAPFIQPHSGVTPSFVAYQDNPLLQEIESELPRNLLQNAVDKEKNEINIRFQRINLLLRLLKIKQDTAVINDPIIVSEINLSALFAENKALDLIVEYKITEEYHISSSMLKDLLSENSQLRKEIESIQLTSDAIVNKNLIRLVIILFEKGLLEKNRQLLQNIVFVKTFGGFMWDELQIKLIPYLMKRKYDEDLIRLILSEKAYYECLNLLFDLNPAFFQDVQLFFKGLKREELKLIDSLKNLETKKLCLIFWVKGNLSVDAYNRIVSQTEKYPLLASTLIAKDKTHTISIENLEKRVLDPKNHLQDSILFHFADELKNIPNIRPALNTLDVKDLESVISSLILLKSLGIKEVDYYKQLLSSEKGQVLNLLLPQLANIKDNAFRKVLVELLYKGVIYGTQIQGNKLLEIKDLNQLAIAQSLRERFICLTQMQKLNFDKKMIELAAKENNEEAERFRQVILKVEAQCNIVYQLLASSVSYRGMLLKWEEEEESYRKTLYRIAYEKLANPKTDILDKLKFSEKKILEIVDPEINSDVYHALIVLANILISVLTFGIANAVKHYYTGNSWFFNQTPAGEKIRALDNDILEIIEQETIEETPVDSLVPTL